MSRYTDRHRRVVLCLAVLCALMTNLAGPLPLPQVEQAHAQEVTWRSIGPYGGNIDAVAFSPNFVNDRTLFAANGSSIFRSIDAGTNWAPLAPFQSNPDIYEPVRHIGVSPRYSTDATLFAVTLGGLYRSTNAGTSWQHVYTQAASALAFSPDYTSDGEMFLALFGDGKIVRSQNGGSTWAPISNGITSTYILDLAVSPNYATDRTIFALGDAVYRTTNGGGSWAKVGVVQMVGGVSLKLSPNYTTDRTILVAGSGEGIWRSRDGGGSWAKIGSEIGGPYPNKLFVSPATTQGFTILAATPAKVWRSANGGSSWFPLSISVSDFEGGGLPGAIAFAPNFSMEPLIVAGSQSEEGVLRSTDAGNTWAESNNGLSVEETAHVRLSPNFTSDGIILANGGSALYRSADGGVSWQRVYKAFANFSVSDIAFSPGFASDKIAFFTAIGLLRTTDGGLTWGAPPASVSAVAPALTLESAVTSVAVSPAFATDNTVFANRVGFITEDSGGLLRSTNRGQSFSRLGPEVGDIELSPNFPADGVMLALDQEIKRSTTAGASWASVFSFGTDERFAAPKVLALAPTFAQDGLALVGTPTRLLRSTDRGATWAPMQQRGVRAIAFSPNYAEDKIIYFALDDGVYRSTDAGMNWALYADPPPGRQITAIAVDSRNSANLFIGTDAGIWSNLPTVCGGAAPPPAVVTITHLADSRGNNIYPLDTNPETPEGSVEGNTIQATVRVLNCQQSELRGVVALTRGSGAQATVPPFASKEVSLPFSADGLAWTNGQRVGAQDLGASFTPTGGGAYNAKTVQFTVRPRPAVLVHGYNDSQQLWLDYFGSTMLGSPELKDIRAYTTPRINTGFNGSPTNTIDQNAYELAKVIEEVRGKERAAQVDVIAHSMGGLITRRYLHAYASGTSVRQLIMLGTPNLGSRSADMIALACVAFNGALLDRDFPHIPVLGRCRSPAIQELTLASTLVFNTINTNTRGAKYSVVAGRYRCLRAGLEAGNSIEKPFPNDIIVSWVSAFGIGLDNRWLYPPEGEGCAGRHEWMTKDSTTQPLGGGQQIFDSYVKPLLTKGPFLGSVASTAALIPPEDTSLLQAIQFTGVQTGTLRPGGKLEFQQPLGVGTDGQFTFSVIGQPAQLTVSLRAPDGTLYTPGTTDPAVSYLRMLEGPFPLTSYTITSTLAGTWTTIVEANVQTPTGGIPVMMLGSLLSDLRLVPQTPDQALLINRSATVAVRLNSAGAPVASATVTGLLASPKDVNTPIVLRDDGQGGDAVRDDGVYSYRFTPRVPGVYSAAITADGIAGAPAGRSALWVANVEGSILMLPIIRR